uniref:Uncharacterized protein n=1 Tax=Hanusia phi TaxID=3032 RepID=A0A7S0H8G8_9CRYP
MVKSLRSVNRRYAAWRRQFALMKSKSEGWWQVDRSFYNALKKVVHFKWRYKIQNRCFVQWRHTRQLVDLEPKRVQIQTSVHCEEMRLPFTSEAEGDQFCREQNLSDGFQSFKSGNAQQCEEQPAMATVLNPCIRDRAQFFAYVWHFCDVIRSEGLTTARTIGTIEQKRACSPVHTAAVSRSTSPGSTQSRLDSNNNDRSDNKAVIFKRDAMHLNLGCLLDFWKCAIMNADLVRHRWVGLLVKLYSGKIERVH